LFGTSIDESSDVAGEAAFITVSETGALAAQALAKATKSRAAHVRRFLRSITPV